MSSWGGRVGWESWPGSSQRHPLQSHNHHRHHLLVEILIIGIIFSLKFSSSASSSRGNFHHRHHPLFHHRHLHLHGSRRHRIKWVRRSIWLKCCRTNHCRNVSEKSEWWRLWWRWWWWWWRRGWWNTHSGEILRQVRTTWAASKRASSKLLFQTIDWNGDGDDDDDGGDGVDGDGYDGEYDWQINSSKIFSYNTITIDWLLMIISFHECAVILKSITWKPGRRCLDAAAGSWEL